MSLRSATTALSYQSRQGHVVLSLSLRSPWANSSQGQLTKVAQVSCTFLDLHAGALCPFAHSGDEGYNFPSPLPGRPLSETESVVPQGEGKP